MTRPAGRSSPWVLLAFIAAAVCIVDTSWARNRLAGVDEIARDQAERITGGEFTPQPDRECIKIDTCDTYNAAKGTPCPTSYSAVNGKCPPKGCTFGCENEPDPAKLGNGYCGNIVYPLDCVADPGVTPCGEKSRGKCDYTLEGSTCKNPTACTYLGKDGMCLDLPAVCKN